MLRKEEAISCVMPWGVLVLIERDELEREDGL